MHRNICKHIIWWVNHQRLSMQRESHKNNFKVDYYCTYNAVIECIPQFEKGTVQLQAYKSIKDEKHIDKCILFDSAYQSGKNCLSCLMSRDIIFAKEVTHLKLNEMKELSLCMSLSSDLDRCAGQSFFKIKDKSGELTRQTGCSSFYSAQLLL